MTLASMSVRRHARLRAGLAVLALAAATACDNADQLAPTTAAPAGQLDGPLAGPTAGPVPTAGTPSLYTGSNAPGISFSVFDLDMAYIGSTITGAVKASGPGDIIGTLERARRVGGRVIARFSGSDSYLKHSDGTFSFSKWQSQVNRFRSVNIKPYIDDGTLQGHFVIDESDNAPRWGGQKIPNATVEAMAAYSKQLWPSLATIARVKATSLKGVNYRYLDAAWAQYASYRGDVNSWMREQESAARSSGLRLVVGLNVLDGGTSRSGIRGYSSGKYAMSASELKTFGSAVMASSYACSFAMWKYTSSYYGRSDIRSAMYYLSSKAKDHARTSCRR